MRRKFVLLGAMLCAAAAPSSGKPTIRHYSATYDACMVAAAGVTAAMRDCSSTEYDRLDKILNARYQAAMKSLPSAKGNALRASERRWIADRKRKCDAAGADEGGGTLALIIVDQCYLDSLYDRVAVLTAMQGR